MSGIQPGFIDQTAVIPVTVTKLNTYCAATSITLVANPTDVFTITGSATKLVKVRSISFSGTNTANTNALVLIVKRSTANAGGTSAAVTAVPLDSTNAAATATVLSYTANPVLGTLVGRIRGQHSFLPVLGSSNVAAYVTYTFDENETQQLTLRNITEVAAINLNGVALGGTTVAAMRIEFTEE